MGETERDKDKVNVVCDWSFFFSARLCVIGSVCVGKYIIARFFPYIVVAFAYTHVPIRNFKILVTNSSRLFVSAIAV